MPPSIEKNNSPKENLYAAIAKEIRLAIDYLFFDDLESAQRYAKEAQYLFFPPNLNNFHKGAVMLDAKLQQELYEAILDIQSKIYERKVELGILKLEAMDILDLEEELKYWYYRLGSRDSKYGNKIISRCDKNWN